MTQIKIAKRAKAILRNYHALEARKYVGDLDAICTLNEGGGRWTK